MFNVKEEDALDQIHIYTDFPLGMSLNLNYSE